MRVDAVLTSLRSESPVTMNTFWIYDYGHLEIIILKHSNWFAITVAAVDIIATL